MMRTNLAGYYDFETRRITVIAGQPLGARVLAHELTHALADQHFHIKSILDSVRDDDDRSTALHALIESIAMLAESGFEDWQDTRDTSRLPLTPAILARAKAQARAEVERIYNFQGKSLERTTTDRISQFYYQWGLLWATTVAERNLGRFHEWFREIHEPSRLPRTTREIFHPGDEPGDATVIPLKEAAGPFLAAHPNVRVVDCDSIGELTLRMWWHLDLTARLATERAPLGIVSDRVLVIERDDGSTLAGLAVLVFDSEAQARNALKPRYVADGGKSPTAPMIPAGTSAIGRTLVVPLGACPDGLMAAAVDMVQALRLPEPPPQPQALTAEVDLFLKEGDPTAWKRLFTAAPSCPRRRPFLERMAVDLFEQVELIDDEESLWASSDDRQLELGRRAAADLPRILPPSERAILSGKAIAAMLDGETLPVGRVNALRWLVAAKPELTHAQVETIRTAALYHFKISPELTVLIPSLLPNTETPAGPNAGSQGAPR